MAAGANPERLTLVVALTSLPLIETEIEALGIDVVDEQTNDILGLARLELSAPAGTLPREKPDGLWVTREPEIAFPEDWLLLRLRHSFSEKYNGWVPSMGKDRVVRSVVSNGIIINDTGMPVAYAGRFDEHTGRPEGYETGASETDGAHARVAILDTKLVAAAALNGKVLTGATDYLDADEPSYRYELGHGAFVAGLIAARAPAATLAHRAVLTGPNVDTSVWDLACAMADLVDRGAQVINLSLGCTTEDNRPPFVLRRAVEVLTPQAVIVAAAGNFAERENPAPFWPAAFDNVVAVGAYDSNPEGAAKFSPVADWVDVVAPGVNVVSLYLVGEVTNDHVAVGEENHQVGSFDGFATWEGTSAAAAIVTGRIAARIGPGRTAAHVVREMRTEGVGEVRPYRGR